ncbi:MAG TPA: hypothetical protein VIE42_05580 [Steroidobacteraceae bacterium]|jgi:hypothetical protein
MTVDEETTWLNALAGRGDGVHASADAAEPALALEARALREFIQSQDPAPFSALPAADAAREHELIERARVEGLLPRQATGSPTVASAAPRRHWFADPRISFAAAAMVLAAIGVGLWRSTLQPPIETLRGVANGTVHLEARDPPALKRQLTQELNAVGVRVSGYERLGHMGLDADLPQPVAAPVAAVLERHHIPIPPDGVLVVEIDAPTRP